MDPREDIGNDFERNLFRLEGSEEETPFTFLVVSDPHVRLSGKKDYGFYNSRENTRNLRHMVERINREFSGAAFAVVTGDLVGCLFSETPEDYLTGEDNPAESFKAIMQELHIPYFVVLGNHDYQMDFDTSLEEGITTGDIRAIEAVWKRVLGIDPYYSFTFRSYRFLFLNSNRGPAGSEVCSDCRVEAMCTGSFDEQQLSWLRQELAHNTPSVIFVHHPPITDRNEENPWTGGRVSYQIQKDDPFYSLVHEYRNTIVSIFTGHGHVWVRDRLYDAIAVYETASLGDAVSDRDNVHVVSVEPVPSRFTVRIGKSEMDYLTRDDLERYRDYL